MKAKAVILEIKSALGESRSENDILGKILKEQEAGVNFCNHKIDLTNDCYNLIEKKLRKLNEIIESFEKTLKNPETKTLEKLISRKKCNLPNNLVHIVKLKKEKTNNIEVKSTQSSKEQLFCHCKNVSYGNMIECDNNQVYIKLI